MENEITETPTVTKNPLEVKLPNGMEFTLRKPKALPFHNALLNAYDPKEKTINTIKMAFELMPFCISKHPFGTIPIKESIDRLDYDQMVVLAGAVGELLAPDIELSKKLEASSGTNKK